MRAETEEDDTDQDVYDTKTKHVTADNGFKVLEVRIFSYFY